MNILKSEILLYINDQLTHDDEDLTIENNSELLISGLLDSLGVMQLVTFISNTYSYAVPPGDITIENFSSVNTIADYLQSRINK